MAKRSTGVHYITSKELGGDRQRLDHKNPINTPITEIETFQRLSCQAQKATKMKVLICWGGKNVGEVLSYVLNLNSIKAAMTVFA